MAAKEELGLFDLACTKVVEAHKLMNEARELVKQDIDNFKEEKSAFEKLSKTLDKSTLEARLSWTSVEKYIKPHWTPWEKIQILCCVRCFPEGMS